MQPQYLSALRYQELREAGPTITAEDHKRLADFQPRMRKLAIATRLACLMVGAYRDLEKARIVRQQMLDSAALASRPRLSAEIEPSPAV